MTKAINPAEEFYQFLSEGRLMLQRCAQDGGFIFYPRVLCPRCGSADLEWIRASGRAKVYSTTTVRRDAEKGGSYNVALVELEEGPRLMSRVEGVPFDDVKIGMVVEANILQETPPLLVFRPAGGIIMKGDLGGKVSIAGIGLAGCGLAHGRTELDLAAEASRLALADAGLSLRDVDGVITASLETNMPVLALCEYLGISPSFSDGTGIGGASFIAHLVPAILALEAGLCNVILIAYGSTPRTGTNRGAYAKSRALLNASEWEARYEPLGAVSAYALAAARYMHEVGATREDLARVAVQSRRWAELNPAAFERTQLTVDDVLSSRMISDPLSVRDCCLVTDGAGAIVLTRNEKAADLRQPPVSVMGVGVAHTHRSISSMPDLTRTCAERSGAIAFAMAGIGREEVDVLQLYDAFTINVLLFLEDLGFCARGEAGALVESGAIGPGGKLPVNTNGGGLSCVHPGMYGIFALIEATEQLRGNAGARQVRSARTALVHGNGGVFSSQATAILGGPNN